MSFEAGERERWYPLSRSEELVPRHIAHAQLLGQELALWRDDVGRANAWENRCPHRGVRLSIGSNCGSELHCRYHGWRFASASGQCTFIPAHPTQKPASTIKARTFPVEERYGFVWVALFDAPPLSSDKRLQGRHVTTMRSLSVQAPPHSVATALSELSWPSSKRVHWLQPVDEQCTVVHAALLDLPAEADLLAVLRVHNAELARVRDLAESRHQNQRCSSYDTSRR
jgi:phenylpropionate dioxygenase-like ring-hydroxylating dioxygenase large terminal subunit